MEKENRLKVVICKGLPASGKTTFAHNWVSDDERNRELVEKDQIRRNPDLFRDGVYNHSRGDESIVIQERDRLINQALSNGKSVVSSDTNLVQKHIIQITNIAKKYDAEVEIVSFLDVPLKELIERDSKRSDSVGEQVIRRMFHQQVGTMPSFVKWDNNLKPAILCDIDGTLAHMNGKRGPFEWNKVDVDDIDLAIAHILDGIKQIDYASVIILSGRDSTCRKMTEEWLEHNCIDYDKLLMREEGDMRDDTIVKSELYENNIRDKYNVLCVIDDRPKIVRMWRDVYGFRVLACGDQDYEF